MSVAARKCQIVSYERWAKFSQLFSLRLGLKNWNRPDYGYAQKVLKQCTLIVEVVVVQFVVSRSWLIFVCAFLCLRVWVNTVIASVISIITSAEGGDVSGSVCLSVCLSVRRITVLKKLWTDFDEISWRRRAWPRDQWVQFWWRSGSLSGSRSPKSEIRIHWIIEKVTNGFWWNFMESCGVAQRPTVYILVTIRITIQMREGESVPDHDPAPGRTATILLCWSSAEVCALWVLIIAVVVCI